MTEVGDVNDDVVFANERRKEVVAQFQARDLATGTFHTGILVRVTIKFVVFGLAGAADSIKLRLISPTLHRHGIIAAYDVGPSKRALYHAMMTMSPCLNSALRVLLNMKSDTRRPLRTHLE